MSRRKPKSNYSDINKIAKYGNDHHMSYGQVMAAISLGKLTLEEIGVKAQPKTRAEIVREVKSEKRKEAIRTALSDDIDMDTETDNERS